MVFIYHFERTEPYFSKVEKMLSSAQGGENEIVTSVISMLETLSAPKYLHLVDMVHEIGLFFREASNITVLGLDGDIAVEAARLRRENTGLRTPDAIQLATAIVGGAKLFVTNDIKLKKVRVDSLEIKMISEFEV